MIGRGSNLRDAEKKPEIDAEILWNIVDKKSGRQMRTKVLSEKIGWWKLFKCRIRFSWFLQASGICRMSLEICYTWIRGLGKHPGHFLTYTHPTATHFKVRASRKIKIMSGDYSTVSSIIQRSSFRQKLFHLITASLRLSKTGVVLPQIRHETVNSLFGSIL